jgi:uncharacterized secreted protein with C-terminal beta-propeller domain
MKKLKILIVVLIIILLGAIGYLIYDLYQKNQTSEPASDKPSALTPPPNELKEEIKFFKNEKEFKEYLEKSSTLGFFERGGGGGVDVAMEAAAPLAAESTNVSKSLSAEPARVSETNVQVIGVDEPDIVKTDGKEIYYTPDFNFLYDFPMEMMSADFREPEKPKTSLFKAFPVDDLNKDGEIEAQGKLLVANKNLVILDFDKVWGYDVSNPKNPEKKWQFDLDEKTSYFDARLFDDKIYLVTQTYIYDQKNCPLKLGKLQEENLEIACNDIYYPVNPIPVDMTYNVIVLNPEDGKVEKKLSFVGFSGSGTLYMSPDNIYITYFNPGDAVQFSTDFVSQENFNLLPSELIEKIKKTNTLDISYDAKYTELTSLVQKYLNSLSSDEQLKAENNLDNAFKDFHSKNLRSFEKTGIVKIERDTLNIRANSYVPGSILNQFSLDEYQKHLRLAVTLGQSGFFIFEKKSPESVNDLYVLDEELKIVGKVNDLGKDEKIYAARFIGDKGYLVTFRETDPFFVFDLSNPEKPELKGELKIPGYSSYLHPINEDKILGIGKNDNEVKVSLFDVSNPSSPQEVSQYTLNEYWSDILDTHHAFLLDSKHEIFFLPGDQGGYVFSYKNNSLSLAHAASGLDATRALYIDDYLYILGQKEIRVYNENTWEEVKKLEF